MSPTSRTRRKALAGGIATVAVLTGAGLLGVGQPWANAAANVSFDTGTGLSFTVNGTNGNMTSLKHNGAELAASGYAAGQFQSGWSSATVTSKTFNNGTSILVSVANTSIGVTQYYFARKNDNTVYMATNISKALNPGEARFIARLKPSLLATSPAAAKTGGATTTVEGSDVFAFANGRTASKFYSSQRLIAQQPFGASGNGHGAYIIPAYTDMTSGGPFFRDIEVTTPAAPSTSRITCSVGTSRPRRSGWACTARTLSRSPTAPRPRPGACTSWRPSSPGCFPTRSAAG